MREEKRVAARRNIQHSAEILPKRGGSRAGSSQPIKDSVIKCDFLAHLESAMNNNYLL